MAASKRSAVQEVGVNEPERRRAFADAFAAQGRSDWLATMNMIARAFSDYETLRIV
jgi:hypothetical protein